MIDTLWLRSHHAKDGMLIGGFTGGAVGAVLLSSLVAQGDSRALAVGVGFIVGAIPSGLMGGMVGAFFPKWDLTYPK